MSIPLSGLPDILTYNSEWFYYPLSEDFVKDLKSWKPQTVPFLRFPPRIRNRIYSLTCPSMVKKWQTYPDVEKPFFAWLRGGSMYSGVTSVMLSLHDARPDVYYDYIKDIRYHPLHPRFVEALESWKPQPVSFLDLPPEIRNRIYKAAVEPSHKHDGVGVHELDFLRPYFFDWSRGGLMHSCKQVQHEFMPMYINSIEAVLRFDGDSRDFGRTKLLWYKEAGPALKSKFSEVRVYLPSFKGVRRGLHIPRNCKVGNLFVKVHPSGEVTVEENLEAMETPVQVRTEMQKKITKSLTRRGPTALLGFEEFKVIFDVTQKYRA